MYCIKQPLQSFQSATHNCFSLVYSVPMMLVATDFLVVPALLGVSSDKDYRDNHAHGFLVHISVSFHSGT